MDILTEIEDFEDLPDKIITYPEEVQQAIKQVIPSDDPLDQPDFNPIDYINNLFPTEQRLSNIDEVLTKTESTIKRVDQDIRTIVRGQTSVGSDGRVALVEAQRVIRNLFLQITDIKGKAERSEETVREITRDIKQLDTAKRNLTAAITTLNQLHMLVGGVDSLALLTGRRQYGEISLPLEGVTEVMKHFESYTDIPQISQLGEKVKKIQQSLANQITQDFKEAINSNNFTLTPLLADACDVLNILDPKVKREILKMYVTAQLREYDALFSGSEDDSGLDKIEKRYVWFKHNLELCEKIFGSRIPLVWEVCERLAVDFCAATKNELANIMGKRKDYIDVKTLLFAIQKTVSFEASLAKKLKVVALTEDLKNKSEGQSIYTGIISECFQPYLYIYIDSLDKNLFELLERSVADSKTELTRDVLPGASLGVLSSSADLFVFYKKCLVQCTQLSNGPPMLSLAATFQKYLREYASKVLQNNLPRFGGSGGGLSGVSLGHASGGSVAGITAGVSGVIGGVTGSMSSGVGSGMSVSNLSILSSGIIQNLNFLKDGDSARFSKQEQARTCCILMTAEYCLATTQQLEKTLKQKIDPSLSEKIQLAHEQDVFHNVISASINLLVHDIQAGCEAPLQTMTKTQWQNVETVGDQSLYVTSIAAHLKQTVPPLRDGLAASKKYFIQVCVKFANNFIGKFEQSLFKCKNVSAAGAEQLLLDTHSLKTVLLGLPLIGSSVNREGPSSYTKVVIKGMTRAEMILKVVMSQKDQSFIDQFIKLLPGSDVQELQRVLDMKGVKQADKNFLVSQFKSRVLTPPSVQGQMDASSLSQEVGGSDSSSIRMLNSLVRKKF